MPAGDEPQDQMAVIVEQTTRMLEERRRKEVAKKMAKLMKNFNYDMLQGLGDSEQKQVEETLQQGSIFDEMDMDDSEMERLRKLQEMTELMAGGGIASREVVVCAKYEAPIITQLRSIETVDELYHLADQIIPYTAKKQ